MTNRNYSEMIKEHLANYKITHLGVTENGIYRSNREPYAHILPKNLKELNILETYRKEFWEYFNSRKKLKLHRDFHHLNSSQAMCFNLFFPFFTSTESKELLLRNILVSPAGKIQEYGFEKIVEPEEGTNFDLYIRLDSGVRLLFELKLSEQDFGNAKSDDSHEKKLKELYKPRLEKKVLPEYLEPKVFFQNYQIMRNISYPSRSASYLLYFIFPRHNESLAKGREFINKVVSKSLKSKAKVIYLEDFVRRILEFSIAKDARFKKHYILFAEKYLP